MLPYNPRLVVWARPFASLLFRFSPYLHSMSLAGVSVDGCTSFPVRRGPQPIRCTYENAFLISEIFWSPHRLSSPYFLSKILLQCVKQEKRTLQQLNNQIRGEIYEHYARKKHKEGTDERRTRDEHKMNNVIWFLIMHLDTVARATLTKEKKGRICLRARNWTTAQFLCTLGGGGGCGYVGVRFGFYSFFGFYRFTLLSLIFSRKRRYKWKGGSWCVMLIFYCTVFGVCFFGRATSTFSDESLLADAREKKDSQKEGVTRRKKKRKTRWIERYE